MYLRENQTTTTGFIIEGYCFKMNMNRQEDNRETFPYIFALFKGKKNSIPFLAQTLEQILCSETKEFSRLNTYFFFLNSYSKYAEWRPLHFPSDIITPG